MRSLEEFAAEGGRPVGPPNRLEVEPTLWSALSWAFGWPILLLRFFRRRRDDRGRFHEMPEGLELVALPRSPTGGTGETDRHGRRIPPKPTYRPPAPPPKMETGHLRSSLSLNELRAIEGDMRRQLEQLRAGGAGGEGSVVIVVGTDSTGAR